jgi:hypothetical protein
MEKYFEKGSRTGGLFLLGVSKEIIFTVRIKGTAFRPEVPHTGKYDVRVGHSTVAMKLLDGLGTVPDGEKEAVEVGF